MARHDVIDPGTCGLVRYPGIPLRVPLTSAQGQPWHSFRTEIGVRCHMAFQYACFVSYRHHEQSQVAERFISDLCSALRCRVRVISQNRCRSSCESDIQRLVENIGSIGVDVPT